MFNSRSRVPSPVLVALGAGALMVEGALRTSGGLRWWAYVLAIASAAPLAWSLRAPLPALAGVEAGAVACAAAFQATWSATAIVVLQLYVVALLGHRQRSVVVGAITAVAAAAAVIAIGGTVEVTGVALRIALVIASVAVGDTVRSRGALRAAARDRAEVERREAEEDARRRAAAERLRIAQELHDTLAHSLVAINVSASVALDLAGAQDPSAALRDIKDASSTALRDLRATLGLLRAPGDSAPTVPALDLDAVPGLLERAHAAGLRTDLEFDVDGAAIPSAIGGAAYRIVQEALTNVLRHADATSARVRVHASSGALDIEVTDDGRAEPGGATPGLGLRGMAERSAALGGQLDVGPVGDRGWRVHAVLPLAPRSPR